MFRTLAAGRPALARGHRCWNDASVRRSAIAVLCLTVATATACGSASAPYDPTGVDELTIPTPAPDPDDFVDEVTNRWLPLVPGTTWEYDDGTTLAATAGTERDGITVTDLARTDPTSSDSRTTGWVDHVAEDRDGNVWWFGRDDVWWIEPGLLMPADPRLGDGFVMADAPGLDLRAEVVGVDETVSVPTGEYDDVVVLDVHEGNEERREYYAAGVGLVAVESGNDTRGLLRVEEPPS